MKKLILCLVFLASCAVSGIAFAAGASERAAGKSAGYDVVVVGGTPGGIMAAIAAAREGCDCVILERTGYIGRVRALASAVARLYAAQREELLLVFSEALSDSTGNIMKICMVPVHSR